MFIGAILMISMLVFFTTFIEGMPVFFAALLSGSVVFVFFLSILVIYRLLEVWRNRRVGLAGSRMHIRLVGLLSIVAIFPTMIAFIFSAVILKQVSQDLFVSRIDRANTSALNVANAYFNSLSVTVGQEMTRVAIDLNIQEKIGTGIEENPIGFRQYLLGQAVLRDWAAIYLLDGNRKILTRVVIVPGVEYRLPPPEAFEAVDQGDTKQTLFHFNAQDSDRLNLFYGMLKLAAYDGGYLIAYKGESPVMSNALLGVRAFRDDNNSYKQRLEDLTIIFTIGYGLLGLIILLTAVWAGLQVANAIVAPVGRLAIASEKISQGDLSERVEVRTRDGELADLAQAFNRMTAQLETQRNDLIDANEQSELRRAFIETVLSGVSAGIIGVNGDGRITLVNNRAAEILGIGSGRLTGEKLSKVAPELYALLRNALHSPDHEASGQVEISRESGDHTVNVRVSGNKAEDSVDYVITFDDITELIFAQRNAAWRDVARRIAHEIKNPLTPIQLSAERLRRKYGNEITSDREVFDRCTDTIIRHVSDIGRMVNEFSSFARMPEPVMAKENAREVLKGAIFPFQVAHSEIEFTTHFPEQDVFILGDGRLILQACTNLIKNACESIEERTAHEGGELSIKGKIYADIIDLDNQVCINIFDNGTGLPKETSHKLTEPYMTTRAKGTGLGLAIVRKVIEDHNGRLSLSNSTRLGRTGALACIYLPKYCEQDNRAASQDQVGEQEQVK
ncbi:MAG: ATP-binding protein [bacterium]